MRFSLALVCLFATVGIAAAAAAAVSVEGTLTGPSIPPHWRLIGAALVGNEDKIYIRVDAEGNCHYEYRQECYPGPNGQIICHQVPTWVCNQTYALFRMPPTVRIQGSDVFWNNGSADLKIGVVKSFLFWKWISLRDGANVQAAPNRAALVLDTDRLNSAPRADRAEKFARLHGQERNVDLLVRFEGATNSAARDLIREAGYEGEFAPTNTWGESDITRDQIGIRVTATEGAALISRLQGSSLVKAIEPYVQAQ